MFHIVSVGDNGSLEKVVSEGSQRHDGGPIIRSDNTMNENGASLVTIPRTCVNPLTLKTVFIRSFEICKGILTRAELQLES